MRRGLLGRAPEAPRVSPKPGPRPRRRPSRARHRCGGMVAGDLRQRLRTPHRGRALLQPRQALLWRRPRHDEVVVHHARQHRARRARGEHVQRRSFFFLCKCGRGKPLPPEKGESFRSREETGGTRALWHSLRGQPSGWGILSRPALATASLRESRSHALNPAQSSPRGQDHVPLPTGRRPPAGRRPTRPAPPGAR